MAKRWVRFAVWLRDGEGGGGRKAEWVMLFMKCIENECVPDCRKCKNVKQPITYYFVENIGHEWCSVASIVAEGGNIARTWLFKRWRV